MKSSDLTREFEIDGNKVDVSIGCTVWWFMEGQTQNIPSPATVLSFCSDNMVNLVCTSPHGNRPISYDGVCLVGDERLGNANNRKRGSWCPRGLWPSLQLK